MGRNKGTPPSMVLKIANHQDHLESILKFRFLGLTYRNSNLVGVGLRLACVFLETSPEDLNLKPALGSTTLC